MYFLKRHKKYLERYFVTILRFTFVIDFRKVNGSLQYF